MTIKQFFQSSQDPNQISLTITSVFKVITFTVTAYAMAKGFDPTQATDGVNQLRDLALQLVPIGFAIYHIGETAHGILRKFSLQAPQGTSTNG